MYIVYALEAPPQGFTKSIFLMGPTPRRLDVESWRPQAIAELERIGYDGVVFYPESRDRTWHGDWAAQVEWEESCLSMAHCIMAWVPRTLPNMPGLTTNVEWGVWQDSKKIVLGAPHDAAHNRYLEYYAGKHGVPVATTLAETIHNALRLIGRNVLDECVFCQIAQTDAHGQVEWHGQDSVVITPLHPVVPGHRLVIPRVHVRDAAEHPGVLARTMRDASHYVNEREVGPHNLIASAGEEATQTVFHLHAHIVPRQEHDELHLPWTGQARH